MVTNLMILVVFVLFVDSIVDCIDIQSIDEMTQ